jgi:hypothetical protein
MGKYLDPTSKSSPYYEDGLFYVGGIATKNVGMQLVETASPSAAASFTFSNLVAGARYMIEYNLQSITTTGQLQISFNGDSTAARYLWHCLFGAVVTGAAPAAVASPDYAYGFFPPCLTLTSKLGYPATGIVNIQSGGANANYATYSSTGATLHNSNSLWYRAETNGLYTGVATLSSITFATSAGTMTGTASLYRLN